MIDPEFFLNEKLASIKAHSRLLYIGLWGLADDNYATLPNRPEWIQAQIFPYEKVDIKMHLKELQNIGDIVLFEHEGQEYWYIPSFFNYQIVQHPSKPKYPKHTHTHILLNESSMRATPQSNIIESNISKSKHSAEPQKQADPVPMTVIAKETTKRADMVLVMQAYHMKKEFAEPYKVWAKSDWAIWAKSAKQLLLKFGSPEAVIACIDRLGSHFDKKGMNWNLNTIFKNSSEYRKDTKRG